MTALGPVMHASPPKAVRQSVVPEKSGEGGPLSPKKGGGQANVIKARTIESWLNRTLSRAGSLPEGAIATAAAKQNQGLLHFGIDAAGLDKLGLDAAAGERVYRAMFVYSQGLHAVLQEAVGRSKNSTTALLVLWRAFTAVLEHAGQNEQQGVDSLASIVQRGNEEERARVENQFKDQLETLRSQSGKLQHERRLLTDELLRVREDELRLRNESELFRHEHEVAMQKYDEEVKQRIEIEVKLLERTRVVEAHEDELCGLKETLAELEATLSIEKAEKQKAQGELENFKTQARLLEAQVSQLKQSILEAAQVKHRLDQNITQLKQQMDRQSGTTAELRDKLELEAENSKRLAEQVANQLRDYRKLERKEEDATHMCKELAAERDLLKEKLERLDKDLAMVVEERRNIQKMNNDLSMDFRSVQLDLGRKKEQLERLEVTYGKLQKEHRDLVDQHRTVLIEAENVKEDLKQIDLQVTRECELRKSLQQEKKTLTGQVQMLSSQLDTTKHAIETTRKELGEATETKVRLERIVRDTKAGQQKVALEHQVEMKAHAQKVAMLEKVIGDERTDRRNLVSEVEDLTHRRDEALELLRKKDLEVRDLRRQRLEKEMEVDRLKILLKAQEQRNTEQLVITDKYHTTVANHEAQTRQMQVLLEGERAEAQRQLQELQDAFLVSEIGLKTKIEEWRMVCEDLVSRLRQQQQG